MHKLLEQCTSFSWCNWQNLCRPGIQNRANASMQGRFFEPQKEITLVPYSGGLHHTLASHQLGTFLPLTRPRHFSSPLFVGVGIVETRNKVSTSTIATLAKDKVIRLARQTVRAHKYSRTPLLRMLAIPRLALDYSRSPNQP
jgi:hypothetical protein